MPWFAAHVVTYFRWTRGPQPRITAWENVHLLEAPDAGTARAMAEALGRALEQHEDETLHEVDATGPHPARQCFAGVRKVVAVAHESADGQLRSGDELTYAEYVLADEAALRRLAEGDAVALTYTSG
jgi:hypothetical protein